MVFAASLLNGFLRTAKFNYSKFQTVDCRTVITMVGGNAVVSVVQGNNNQQQLQQAPAVIIHIIYTYTYSIQGNSPRMLHPYTLP